jgi:hypothetical protein
MLIPEPTLPFLLTDPLLRALNKDEACAGYRGSHPAAEQIEAGEVDRVSKQWIQSRRRRAGREWSEKEEEAECWYGERLAKTLVGLSLLRSRAALDVLADGAKEWKMTLVMRWWKDLRSMSDEDFRKRSEEAFGTTGISETDATAYIARASVPADVGGEDGKKVCVVYGGVTMQGIGPRQLNVLHDCSSSVFVCLLHQHGLGSSACQLPITSPTPHVTSVTPSDPLHPNRAPTTLVHVVISPLPKDDLQPFIAIESLREVHSHVLNSGEFVHTQSGLIPLIHNPLHLQAAIAAHPKIDLNQGIDTVGFLCTAPSKTCGAYVPTSRSPNLMGGHAELVAIASQTPEGEKRESFDSLPLCRLKDLSEEVENYDGDLEDADKVEEWLMEGCKGVRSTFGGKRFFAVGVHSNQRLDQLPNLRLLSPLSRTIPSRVILTRDGTDFGLWMLWVDQPAKVNHGSIGLKLKERIRASYVSGFLPFTCVFPSSLLHDPALTNVLNSSSLSFLL